MKNMIVTPASNLEIDDEGNVIFDEDDLPALKDEDLLGMVLRTHAVNIVQFNPNTQQSEAGCVFRLEVVWEHKRVPAVEFVDPADLAWISLENQDDEENKGKEQNESGVENENEFETVHEDDTSEDPEDDEGYF